MTDEIAHAYHPPPAAPQHVRHAIGALRMIFWAGLVWLVDFHFSYTSNGRGYRFDILNDVVATTLITVALFKLAAIDVSPRYALFLSILKAVAFFSIANAALNHFIFPRPAFISILTSLLSLAQFAGIILFCLAMRELAQAAWLDAAARSWRTTTLLFLVLYAGPLALFTLATLFATLGRTSFHLNLGPFVLVLLPLLLAPIVHLFISISRTSRAHPATPPSAFPVITSTPNQ